MCTAHTCVDGIGLVTIKAVKRSFSVHVYTCGVSLQIWNFKVCGWYAALSVKFKVSEEELVPLIAHEKYMLTIRSLQNHHISCKFPPIYNTCKFNKFYQVSLQNDYIMWLWSIFNILTSKFFVRRPPIFCVFPTIQMEWSFDDPYL